MDEELKQIDEVMAVYKPQGAKNKTVLMNLLTDVEEWAEERGFVLSEVLEEVHQKRAG